MKQGFLSEYFFGVTAKRLSAVEANPDRSNQHEYWKKLLGEGKLNWPGLYGLVKKMKVFPRIHMSHGMTHAGGIPRAVSTDFKSNPVMEIANEGDLLIIAKRPSGELLIIVVAKGSTVENQLLWLFGVPG